MAAGHCCWRSAASASADPHSCTACRPSQMTPQTFSVAFHSRTSTNRFLVEQDFQASIEYFLTLNIRKNYDHIMILLQCCGGSSEQAAVNFVEKVDHKKMDYKKSGSQKKGITKSGSQKKCVSLHNVECSCYKEKPDISICSCEPH